MSGSKPKPFAKELKGRQRFQRLLGNTKESNSPGSGFVVLKSRQSIGIHSTENKQELIVILKGKARIHYGKKGKFDLSKTSFVYLPPNTIHNVENRGSGLLKYVYITQDQFHLVGGHKFIPPRRWKGR